MKKKILNTIAIFTLLSLILAGCTQTTSPTPQPSAANPAPMVSGGVLPTATLPPTPISTTADNAADSSTRLQSDLLLKVSEPADAATLTEANIAVKGQTQPGASVSVNDQIGTADSQGNFSIPLSLDDGLNAIDIIAVDNNGNQGEVLLMVNVDSSNASSSKGTAHRR